VPSCPALLPELVLSLFGREARPESTGAARAVCPLRLTPVASAGVRSGPAATPGVASPEGAQGSSSTGLRHYTNQWFGILPPHRQVIQPMVRLVALRSLQHQGAG
jgi:hypothetical protein